MPRHTHPGPVRKHSRAHLREQRSRFIVRNWGKSKRRYGYSWIVSLHPEVARRQPDHPDAWWPFDLPANVLTRNPFNRCSCEMCSVRPEHRRLRRHREDQWLRGEIAEQAEELEAFPRTIQHHGQPRKMDGGW